MITTILDKSKVKTLDDFKKLQWINATPEQKASVSVAMPKLREHVGKK